jgi:hypothetical protein
MAVAHSRDARSQMRDPLYSSDWRALSCTDCSKPSRTTSPLASILASSRIWSAPLPLSLRRQAHGWGRVESSPS